MTALDLLDLLRLHKLGIRFEPYDKIGGTTLSLIDEDSNLLLVLPLAEELHLDRDALDVIKEAVSLYDTPSNKIGF
jgi:hypothetical protein